MFNPMILVIFAFLTTSMALKSPKVAPYVDIMMEGPSLSELGEKTGSKAFTLAFALGGGAGCVPTWGGELPIDEPKIIKNIKDFQAKGGEVIVATGGALGPYLEAICSTEATLTEAYLKILDAVATNHLDIDIEASVPLLTMVKALKKVQDLRPKTTVRFTLMVQGDDYGLTPELGVKLLQAAKDVGLRVDIVNPMTMEFGSKESDWGDAVIAALKSTLGQMAKIWPEKSEASLWSMLGATPMIGRNFNGRVFDLKHAHALVAFAKKTGLGYLGFWSVGRDNGKCPQGGVSPSCSSVAQSDYEFTKIFNEYNDETEIHDGNHGTVAPPKVGEGESNENEIGDGSTTTSTTTSTTPSPPKEKICKGLETRFDDWCVANCALGHCPTSICSCHESTVLANPPKLVYRLNRI